MVTFAMQMDLSIPVTSFLALPIYLCPTSLHERFEMTLITDIKQKTNILVLTLSL